MSKSYITYNIFKTILSLAFVIICYDGINVYGNINPINMYFTIDSTHPDTNFSVAYPHVGMSSGSVYGVNDWNYVNPQMYYYLVPIGNQEFMSGDLIISWDSTMGHVMIQGGNLFSNFYIDTSYLTTGMVRINISSLIGNVMPGQNKFLVKVIMRITKPGKNNIKLVKTDIRYYDFLNDIQYKIPTNSNNATVKFYLGDFASSRTLLDTADGKVNFHDVAIFAQCYGSQRGDSLYQAKFDIAPTQNNLDYWSMPVGDGKIDFLDLIVFALGYNYYGEGVLNNFRSDLGFYAVVRLGKPDTKSNKVKVPLMLDGTGNDIRAVSISFSCDYHFESVEKFDKTNNNIFLAATKNGKLITIDAAVLGLTNPGFRSPCTLAYLIFDAGSGILNKNSIKLLNGLAVNSQAQGLRIKIEK